MSIKFLKEIIKLYMADPAYGHLKKRIKSHTNKSFYIIGGPVHGNLGDHAIMEEEKCFVKEFFPDYGCEEILMPFFNTQKAFLKKYISQDDIVCVSGGGWMGDLWVHNEITIREIITMFPNNRVIIFPQTLYYSDTLEGNKVLSESVRILANHNNLLICARDKSSIDLIVKKFSLNGNSSFFYCPDMVLFGGMNKPKLNNVEKIINVCIRDDCEGLNKGAKQLIKKYIPDGYSICEIETVVPYRVKLRNRIVEINKSWRSFAKASLTITDRLHAMLFSYINGTPCIALDNKTGKVFGVAKWIESTGMVKCISSVNIVPEVLDEALNKAHSAYNPDLLRKEFQELAKLIRKGI